MFTLLMHLIINLVIYSGLVVFVILGSMVFILAIKSLCGTL